MIRITSVLFFISLSLTFCGQSGNTEFAELIHSFENGYRDLDIPQLQLSYVENLEGMADAADLKKQLEFFNNQEDALQQIRMDELSEDDQMTLAVLVYEIKLNQERLALAMKWRKKKSDIVGEGLFHEVMGREWYAYFLKKWVDTTLTPQFAYNMGLSQIEEVVKRKKALEKEMVDNAHKPEDYALSDHRIIHKKYRSISDRVREKAKDYFPHVDEVPQEDISPSRNPAMAMAPAYYSNNTFYYNFFEGTYDEREMGWIYLHEAVPGHHYQNHIAALVSESPRQQFWYMGFAEGWAAYIEQFGQELGAYETAVDEYSQLEWDLIRSVRVCMDVGLNYFGWTDRKALDFWRQYMTDKDPTADREIKRMKRWPAQVITYKYGKYVFDQLKGHRSQPEELKSFHWEVLKHGDLPLSVLQWHMNKVINKDEEKHKKYRERLSTIDQTIDALYGVISGPQGQERDWDFLRFILHPEARFVVSSPTQDGNNKTKYVDVEDYIKQSGPWMLEYGFFEKEMHRVTERFGPLAHVFSSYECFHHEEDMVPFMRGINSIQLIYTGNHWQVMSICFTQESENNPIPSQYLGP